MNTWAHFPKGVVLICHDTLPRLAFVPVSVECRFPLREILSHLYTSCCIEIYSSPWLIQLYASRPCQWFFSSSPCMTVSANDHFIYRRGSSDWLWSEFELWWPWSLGFIIWRLQMIELTKGASIFMSQQTEQTWSGFSPTAGPDNNRQSGLSRMTVQEMSTGVLCS